MVCLLLLSNFITFMCNVIIYWPRLIITHPTVYIFIDSHLYAKRRKFDVENEPPKQVDAHIRTFLESIFKSSQKNDSSGSAREALATVVSKTLRKRRQNVPRCDASTQTEEEDVPDDSVPERSQSPPSPTSLLTENAAAYYASAIGNAGFFAPSNTDLQYYTTSTSTSAQPCPTELRQHLSNWQQDFQRWFRENFGVDIDSVSVDSASQLTPQPDLDTGTAIACQTPFNVVSNPVICAQPVVYAAPPMLNHLSSLINARTVAQNLITYFLAQQQQQLVAMAAAATASLAALPTPIVYLPPAKPSSATTSPSAKSEVIDPNAANSPELCGPVTHYGVYGILRSCPLDVMETQKSSTEDKSDNCEAELPIYTTPEDYRTRLQTWMPPPPPPVQLLRKQTLICIVMVRSVTFPTVFAMVEANLPQHPLDVSCISFT